MIVEILKSIVLRHVRRSVECVRLSLAQETVVCAAAECETRDERFARGTWRDRTLCKIDMKLSKRSQRPMPHDGRRCRR